MIYESRFWKNDLLKQTNSLRSRLTQKRWTETSLARLEQTVMLGFYSIRKLIEARKLSDSVENQLIDTNLYSWRGKEVTRFNRDRVDELYNFDTVQSVTKDLMFFCNQFVHSYVFIIAFDENNYVDGIFVSSDRERNKALYFIEVRKIIDLFEQVGNDYPRSVYMISDDRLRDYRVLNLDSDDPDKEAKIQKLHRQAGCEP